MLFDRKSQHLEVSWAMRPMDHFFAIAHLIYSNIHKNKKQQQLDIITKKFVLGFQEWVLEKNDNLKREIEIFGLCLRFNTYI